MGICKIPSWCLLWLLYTSHFLFYSIYIFHTKYFHHVPPLSPSRSYLPPYPPILMSFFSSVLFNKTSKNKIKWNKQTKINTKTSSLLNMEYLFVLAKLLLGLGLPSILVDTPGGPPLQTTDFPPLNRHQLQIAKFLSRVEFCSYPLLSVRIFVWFESVKVLCILSLSLWVHMCITSVVLGGYCFLGVLHLLWLL